MMRRRRHITVGAIGFVALLFAAPSAPAQSAREQLAASEIEPTATAIRAYLARLVPSPERSRRIDEWLAALGDDDFWVRERASKAIREEPVVPVGKVRDLLSDSDPEVAWRAKRILRDVRNGEHVKVLRAVLVAIREERIRGLAAILLEALPHMANDALRFEARRSLAATARAEDVPRLRAALSSERADVRRAAVVALEAAAGESGIDAIRGLLDDPDERVRCTAATAVLNLGGRDALGSLVELLDAEDSRVRARAAGALRVASGQSFAFSMYADAAARASARAKWAEWVREEGPTARLDLPVDRAKPFLGRIVVGGFRSNRVIVGDFDGKVLASAELPNAFACRGLPSGGFLVGSHSGRRVVEYDAQGGEVWSAAVPGSPTGVQRLDNGHTLVAMASTGLVELDTKGDVVWRAKVAATDAKRLPNGHTICALYQTGEIHELDPRGNVVWKIATKGKPYGVSPQPDGTLLVAEFGSQGRVVVYRRDGTVVRSYDGLSGCYSASLTPDGRIVAGTSQGVVVIHPDGERTTLKLATQVVYAHAY